MDIQNCFSLVGATRRRMVKKRALDLSIYGGRALDRKMAQLNIYAKVCLNPINFSGHCEEARSVC